MAVASAALAGGLVAFAMGPPRVSQGRTQVWHVRPGSSGTGSAAAPYGSIRDALAVAQAGDEVRLASGRYTEPLRTVRGGTAQHPLVVRAADPKARPVVEVPGRVATVAHPYVVLDGLVLDGAYGDDDAVRVSSAATGLVLRNLEIRRSTRDCVDMAAPADVLVEHTRIHHCLNAARGRTDAHGLVAGAVERLTVRDTEIHTFSGDGVQIDPGRTAPGWTDVRLERLTIWLAPLPEAVNGFAKGVVPGENAVDTKTVRDGRRARLDLRDIDAWGFEGGLITNMAAFNLKERVDATIDGVTVHHSDIAFRLRGPGDAGARVTVRNAVVHHVRTAFRYEDDLARLQLAHVTFGREVRTPLRAVNAAAGPELRNLLVLAPKAGPEWQGHATAVDASAFVNASSDDYRLGTTRRALVGPPQPAVTVDRAGRRRPTTGPHALGAYEP